MLKLERTRGDSQPTVIYNDQERFLNSHLLTAFAIAAAIHLVIFALFQITSIKVSFNEKAYPPALVQIETLPAEETTVMANASRTELTKDRLPLFPPSKPNLPTIPEFLAVGYIDDIKQKANKINPFFEIEKDIYEMSLTCEPSSSHKNNVEIAISGPLSTFSIERDGWNEKHPSLIVKKNTRAIYSVFAEATTGKIVWYLMRESTNDAHLDKVSEQMLLAMQFTKKATGFTIGGEIEIKYYNTEELRKDD